MSSEIAWAIIVFLSTLSLRRATTWLFIPPTPTSHFYPRSPCGERLLMRYRINARYTISIHALLAESDHIVGGAGNNAIRISIHALLAESDGQAQSLKVASLCISIHALLAESDSAETAKTSRDIKFLSTLSLRRATANNRTERPRQHDFYPRSPCGERRRPGLFFQ